MPQGTDHHIDFTVARWHAWAPGADTAASWSCWLSGTLAADPDAQPDVSQLPPLLRRRLDRLGRMALHTAWSCLDDMEAAEFVFASRHGALRRTVDLLIALAHDEPLSPTLFSVSVHNGTAGLYSIARRDHRASTAIAAGRDTLGMGLLEGAAMVAAGTSQVLVCYADDCLPLPYVTAPGAASDACAPFSISLLLKPAAPDQEAFRLAPGNHAAAEDPCKALLRFLVEQPTRAVIGMDQPWQLERRCHAG
jgi:hypothetical protein